MDESQIATHHPGEINALNEEKLATDHTLLHKTIFPAAEPYVGLAPTKMMNLYLQRVAAAGEKKCKDEHKFAWALRQVPTLEKIVDLLKSLQYTDRLKARQAEKVVTSVLLDGIEVKRFLPDELIFDKTDFGSITSSL